MQKPCRAQGALEYLLLIGGAVVVAAVVTVFMLSTGSTGAGSVPVSISEIDEGKEAQGFDTSLVVNSSFERGTDGWTANGGPPQIVSSDCYNGSNCVYIPASGSAWNGYVQYIPLQPDTAYVAMIYKKGYCRLHGHLLDSSNNYVRNIADFAGLGNTSSTEWEKLSAEITTNSSANSITVTNSSGTNTYAPTGSPVSQLAKIRLYVLRNAGTETGYCDLALFEKK